MTKIPLFLGLGEITRTHAHSPRILRAFSAHSPRIFRARALRGKCAENARRMRGEYAENARRMRVSPRDFPQANKRNLSEEEQ